MLHHELQPMGKLIKQRCGADRLRVDQHIEQYMPFGLYRAFG